MRGGDEMSKHTPGPWRWEKGQPHITAHWYGDKYVKVATVVEPEWHEDRGMADLEAGANAQFIVRAVNNHEELLEACKAALRAFGKAYGGQDVSRAKGLLEEAIKAAERPAPQPQPADEGRG